MIIADTSAWIDYFNGIEAVHTDRLDRELDSGTVIVGDLILAEFLQGFRGDREYRLALDLMNRLEYRDFVGRDIALKSAGNYRILRSQGITVRKTVDMLIATYCLEHQLTLIHNDRDFNPMAEILGLKVIGG